MQIRPQTFGENLSAWFKVLGRCWKPILLVSAVAFVPAAVATFVIFAVTGGSDAFAAMFDEDLVNSLTDEELFDLFVPFFWAVGLWTLALIIPTVFVYLAVSRIVAADVTGLTPDWRVASGTATRRFAKGLIAGIALAMALLVLVAGAGLIGWRFIDSMGANFGSVFLTAVVALTVLVVVTWLGMACSLYAQSIGLENTGAVESLKRSFDLISGRWWITFGFVAVIGLISSVAAQILGVFTTPLFLFSVSIPWLLGAAYATITLIQAPVAGGIAAGYALWYLDLWARKETLMSEQLAD